MDTGANGQEINLGQIDLRRATAKDRLAYGSKIKQLRVAAGLRQEDLAEQAGVTRRTLGSIERGDVAGQAENLKRILLVLGVATEPRTWSRATEEYIAILAPLIESLPPEALAGTMNQVIQLLASALPPRPVI